MSRTRKTPATLIEHICWALVALILATCGSADNFNVATSATATMASGTSPGTLSSDLGFAALTSVDLKTNSAFVSQGLSDNDIGTVHVLQLTLTITSPASGQDFSFLQAVRFYVEAPNVAKAEIASGADFTSGATNVVLNLDNIDLKAYVAAGTMKITTAASGTLPGQNTVVEANITFAVDATTPGLKCYG